MKLLPLLLLLGLGLTSCQKDSDATPTGLVGNWKLVDRQCECSSKLPNETVTFTATEVSFYKDGNLTGSYTYTATTGLLCGIASETTGITMLPTGLSHGNPSFAGSTVSATNLTLDWGSPCDAPRDTYRRLP